MYFTYLVYRGTYRTFRGVYKEDILVGRVRVIILKALVKLFCEINKEGLKVIVAYSFVYIKDVYNFFYKIWFMYYLV